MRYQQNKLVGFGTKHILCSHPQGTCCRDCRTSPWRAIWACFRGLVDFWRVMSWFLLVKHTSIEVPGNVFFFFFFFAMSKPIWYVVMGRFWWIDIDHPLHTIVWFLDQCQQVSDGRIGSESTRWGISRES